MVSEAAERGSCRCSRRIDNVGARARAPRTRSATPSTHRYAAGAAASRSPAPGSASDGFATIRCAVSVAALFSAFLVSPQLAVAQAEPPAALIGGAPIVGQISGLHDQTQRVVLLAPNVDAHSTSEIVRGLATLGVRAVTVREARLDPALEACGTFGCLSQVARASQGRAALVNVTRNGDGSSSILLVLVEGTGGSAQARTRIGAAGIAEAVTAAWKETSLSLALAGDAMIHAESRPAGASVWLDGAPAGSTPFARQVGPGRHTVLVKLEGFVAEERTIVAKPGRAERIQLSLRREQRFGRDELTRTTEPLPSVWNSIVGGALIIAAAPALIASLNALASDGECLKVRASDANTCAHRASFGGQSAALLTGGVLAFGAGTTLLLAQPIE